MLPNYFKTAVRNLLRQKTYTAINIAGLAIGMSAFLIILMLVHDELSYDRFHENTDRLYRITFDAQLPDRELRTARSSGPVAPTLRAELPEIEAATHFRSRNGKPTGNVTVRYENTLFTESRVFFTDSSFFNVFSIDVLEGDPKTFLTQPNTVIITDDIARKYFGAKSALGKMLEIDGDPPYTVAGVVKGFPPQSHWQFDMLASIVGMDIPDKDNWINNTWYTYVLLKAGASPEHAESTFQTVVNRNIRPVVEQILGIDWREGEARGLHYRYRFQPITDVHLHSQLDEEILPGGNAVTVYSLILIAVFVLAIACINYMNLNTARSARRAKEVGVRKALGSDKSQLVILFIGEAVLLTAIAAVMSFGIIELLLPVINNLTLKSLSLSVFINPWAIAGLVIFTVSVGIFAGSYPAFILSAFQPVKVLKGELGSGMRNSRLRNFLVVTQFAVTIALIIGTMVVYNQLQFIRTSNLGFDQEQLLVVDNTWLLGRNSESFKETLLHQPGITGAAYIQILPGRDIDSGVYRREGDESSQLIRMRQLWSDYDFLPLMDIRLKEGRYFSSDYATDINNAVIINESAANILGYEQPIGRRLVGFFGNEQRTMSIVGITEDVHYEPLHEVIYPKVMMISRSTPMHMVVRIEGNINAIINTIETHWNEFSGGQPFSWFFLDDRLDQYYRTDRAFGKLIGIFTGIGIFISCIGLLGLSTYSTEQRTKEIGIRKVLGASVPGIVGLLSKEFLKLVVIANIIAWPVAYVAMNKWLEGFAYRIDPGIRFFVTAGIIAILIALISVSYQAINAALANPGKSLKYE